MITRNNLVDFTQPDHGALFFGILPLEEVVFFFITNILLTFGMTLLLANISQERFVDIKNQIQTYPEHRRRGMEK